MDARIVQIDAVKGMRAHTPLRMLRRSLKHDKLEREWISLSSRWFAVRPVTINLARYLTTIVPSVNESGRSLLGGCVRQAIECWHANGPDERERFFSYVRGLLFLIPEVLDWSVEADREGQRVFWNPMENCVIDWWSRHRAVPQSIRRRRPHDSSFADISPANYRTIVLVKFLARGGVDLGALAPRIDELVCRFG